MNYLDVAQFESYVTACAKNTGVKVMWDKPTSTPRTDGTNMWIPSITSTTSAEWLARIRYFVKHETSHIVHSDFVYLNKVKPTGLLALINNLIEDHRIDYLNDGEYDGDKLISSAFWEYYAADVSKRIASEDEELSEQQLLVTPLFVWDALNRDWIGSAAECVHAMSDMLDEKGMERLEKLLQPEYTDALLKLREHGDAAAVYALATKILVDLYEQDPKDYEGDTAKTKGTPSGGAGKGGADEEDGAPVADDVDRIIDVTKLQDAIGHEHKPSRTGIRYTGDDTTGRSYTIPKPDEYIVLRFPELHSSVRSYGKGYLDTLGVTGYITSNAKPLANKLRIALQTRSRDKYEYGQRRGKLHNGSLHRLLHEDKAKVFRKRVVSDTLDTAVCLLVDCSGSMSGRKFDMACSGAGALAEALKPLNIQFTTLGFTNHADKRDAPMIWVFNDFGERVATSELVTRFGLASGMLWENTDGDAIAYAHAQLAQRKEKRKVLIVLSDGGPAGRSWAGDIHYYTKDAISNTEKSGIDVYGIGICDTNVKKYYTKYEVVDRLDDLSKTILNIIDRSI